MEPSSPSTGESGNVAAVYGASAEQAARAGALVTTKTLHVDGVADSSGFLFNHYGNDVPVPQGVHFLVYRALTVVLNKTRPKFSLRDLDALDLQQLLSSRFVVQPGVTAENKITTATASDLPRETLQMDKMMLVGIFCEGYANGSSAAVGLRAGMMLSEPTFDRKGDGKQKMAAAKTYWGTEAKNERFGSRPAPEAKLRQPIVDEGLPGDLEKRERTRREGEGTENGFSFLFERCVRVACWNRGEKDGARLVEYSALLAANSSDDTVTRRMSDPVWQQHSDFFHAYPFLNVDIVDHEFPQMPSGHDNSSHPSVMVPLGHPLGDMTVRTLRALYAEALATQQSTDNLPQFSELTVGNVPYVVVSKDVLEGVRATLREKLGDLEVQKQMRDIRNVTITAEAVAGDEADFEVTVNLGLLFAPLALPEGASAPLHNYWLSATAVRDLMAEGVPEAARRAMEMAKRM